MYRRRFISIRWLVQAPSRIPSSILSTAMRTERFAEAQRRQPVRFISHALRLVHLLPLIGAIRCLLMWRKTHAPIRFWSKRSQAVLRLLGMAESRSRQPTLSRARHTLPMPIHICIILSLTSWQVRLLRMFIKRPVTNRSFLRSRLSPVYIRSVIQRHITKLSEASATITTSTTAVRIKATTVFHRLFRAGRMFGKTENLFPVLPAQFLKLRMMDGFMTVILFTAKKNRAFRQNSLKAVTAAYISVRGIVAAELTKPMAE